VRQPVPRQNARGAKLACPLKWSSMRYGFWPEGGRENAEEEARIVAKLRQVEVLTAQGLPVAEAIRSIGMTE
jgi:hypothetical protein